VFTARYELYLYTQFMLIVVLKGQRYSYVIQDSFDASRNVYKEINAQIFSPTQLFIIA
jgi:hypothetical protein